MNSLAHYRAQRLATAVILTNESLPPSQLRATDAQLLRDPGLLADSLEISAQSDLAGTQHWFQEKMSRPEFRKTFEKIPHTLKIGILCSLGEFDAALSCVQEAAQARKSLDFLVAPTSAQLLPELELRTFIERTPLIEAIERVSVLCRADRSYQSISGSLLAKKFAEFSSKELQKRTDQMIMKAVSLMSKNFPHDLPQVFFNLGKFRRAVELGRRMLKDNYSPAKHGEKITELIESVERNSQSVPQRILSNFNRAAASILEKVEKSVVPAKEPSIQLRNQRAGSVFTAAQFHELIHYALTFGSFYGVNPDKFINNHELSIHIHGEIVAHAVHDPRYQNHPPDLAILEKLCKCLRHTQSDIALDLTTCALKYEEAPEKRKKLIEISFEILLSSASVAKVSEALPQFLAENPTWSTQVIHSACAALRDAKYHWAGVLLTSVSKGHPALAQQFAELALSNYERVPRSELNIIIKSLIYRGILLEPNGLQKIIPALYLRAGFSMLDSKQGQESFTRSLTRLTQSGLITEEQNQEIAYCLNGPRIASTRADLWGIEIAINRDTIARVFDSFYSARRFPS